MFYLISEVILKLNVESTQKLKKLLFQITNYNRETV